MIRELQDMVTEDYTLNLVIGEDIPSSAPDEFHTVKLYVRDKDDNLNLYADISLPYLINHSEFLDIKDDPRYFFKEEYDPKTKGCKYICEIKPLGITKGVYRILNGQSIKIGDIEPLCELDKKNIDFTEKYGNLINTDIPKKWLPNPESGYVPSNPDLVKLASKTKENGFVENYCLNETEVKKLRLIRNNKGNYNQQN